MISNNKKKKLRNKTTRRFLTFFSRYIIYPTLQRRGKRRRWRMPRSHEQVRIESNTKSLSSLKPALFTLIASYNRFSRQTGSKLLHSWFTKYDFTKARRRRGKRWWYQRPPKRPKRFVYVRRLHHYLVSPLMDAILQQHHFGFSSLTSFKCFVQKNRQKLGGNQLKAFGIEGMLANQLCRAGVIDDIRKGYVLVKAGAVLVNSREVRNPRKILIVGDSFSIRFPFNRLLVGLLKTRLKKEIQFFNIAPYLEYNLRMLSFRIYRAPTLRELSIMAYYPYKKNPIDFGNLVFFLNTYKGV